MKTLKYIISWLFGILSLVGVAVGLYFLYDEGYSIPFVILIGFYSLTLFVSIIVFVQNRQIVGKSSWMMFFLIFPFIAPAAFVLFGQRYKGRMSLKRYFKKETFKFENRKLLPDNSDENSILNKQSFFAKRGIYASNAQMFQNGDQAYEQLFKDLENAKKFIHLQYYIIKPGEIFDQLKDILIRKAKEGVEVRFIVDDFGRWAVPWYTIKELKRKGIIIGRFGKVNFPFLSSYNCYRYHRKVAIIDGIIAHSGGLNIADEYSSLNKRFGLWIDYQMRFEGPAVRSYSLLFIDDWGMVSDEKLDFKKYLLDRKEVAQDKTNCVLVEDSPEVLEPRIQDSIIHMILFAKKEIILTTPYLVPTPELLMAIRTASLNGVSVKIIIPGKADKKAVIIATKYYASILHKYGVEIYQTKNILIHAKMGLFDNKYAYSGTANLDVRSLYGQWEVIQVLSGEIIKDFRKTTDYYLSLAKKLSRDEFKINRVMEGFIRIYVNLFSPIM